MARAFMQALDAASAVEQLGRVEALADGFTREFGKEPLTGVLEAARHSSPAAAKMLGYVQAIRLD